MTLAFVVPLRLIDLSMGGLAREISRPLMAALGMAAIVTVARPFAAGLDPLPALLALVMLGVVTHVAALLVIDRDRVRDVLSLVAARK